MVPQRQSDRGGTSKWNLGTGTRELGTGTWEPGAENWDAVRWKNVPLSGSWLLRLYFADP